MNFSETYRTHERAASGPSPDLIAQDPGAQRRRRRFPWRRSGGGCCRRGRRAPGHPCPGGPDGDGLLCCCTRVSPAVAQFFQPVQDSPAPTSGVTMEVAAVRVEGDTAQAYITLSGGPCGRRPRTCSTAIPSTCPLTRSGHCEQCRLGRGRPATVTFLCTVQTMDGSPIPAGGKMTFSVSQLLTGQAGAGGRRRWTWTWRTYRRRGRDRGPERATSRPAEAARRSWWILHAAAGGGPGGARPEGIDRHRRRIRWTARSTCRPAWGDIHPARTTTAGCGWRTPHGAERWARGHGVYFRSDTRRTR